jgi:hypothetical protein
LIDESKNHESSLKIKRNIKEYLSCCIEESKDEGKLTTIQLHLLNPLDLKISEGKSMEKEVPYSEHAKVEVLKINNGYRYS